MTRALISRSVLYSIAAIIAFGIYERSQTPIETDEAYCERTGKVKIHGRFFQYDVYEKGEMRSISDMLSKECNGNKYCEVDRAYQYVLKIPYKESIVSRTPSDVINQNGGDCDEKSFLLASLLLQQGYPCVLVTTKDHGFLAIHFEDPKVLSEPLSYLLIDEKKYYFAETTGIDGFVGAYNGVEAEAVEGIFDMVSKKEISLDKVKFQITQK